MEQKQVDQTALSGQTKDSYMAVKYMGLIDGMMGVLSSKVKMAQENKKSRSTLSKVTSIEKLLAQKDQD